MKVDSVCTCTTPNEYCKKCIFDYMKLLGKPFTENEGGYRYADNNCIIECLMDGSMWKVFVWGNIVEVLASLGLDPVVVERWRRSQDKPDHIPLSEKEYLYLCLYTASLGKILKQSGGGCVTKSAK